MASSTIDVGGNTLLVWLHGREVSPFMNGLHFCFGVGAFVSPLVVAQALRLSGDISWAYWILASLIAPAALWILRLPSPTAPSNHNDNETYRSSPLMVVLIAIVLLLYVGAESSMGGWIYTYATATGLGNDAQAAYLTSLFWGVFTAGRLLSIPMVRRLSPRRMLTLDWLGCLISVGAMVFLGDAPVTVWLGTVGVGLSMASIFPIMISFAERHMSITGEITGWFFVGASLGGMTLPWLIGQLFESIGPRVTMSAILVDLALATVVFGALMVYAQVQDEQ
jgi:FHS family Na+ dependent glucose MFS transporter 1